MNQPRLHLVDACVPSDKCNQYKFNMRYKERDLILIQLIKQINKNI